MILRDLSAMPPISATDAHRIQCNMQTDSESIELWYEFLTAKEDLLPCVSYDAFVLPALLMCMKAGKDLVVEGEVSQRLAFAISNGLQDIIAALVPGLRQIRFSATPAYRPPAKVRGAVTGISLGIDSLAVCQRYLEGEGDDRIRCLIFNDVGSHGATDEERVYQQRRRDVCDFAKAHNVPIVFVRSNIDRLIPLSFEESHTLRNVSAAFLLQSHFDKFYYGAGLPYSSMRLKPLQDTAYGDAALLPYISTEAMSAFLVGAGMTRVEKAILISSNKDFHSILDVCVTPHLAREYKNCSKCKKCLRTMIILEMIGELDSYSSVFDASQYKREKKKFLAILFSDKKDTHEEILDYARSTGYRFGLSRSAYAVLRVKAVLRRIYWAGRLRTPPGLKAPLRHLLLRLGSR